MSSDRARLIESVLVHVDEERRSFLRSLLTAVSAAMLATPLMTSTAMAWWAEDECYYWERKVKKGKWPGEFSIEVKKKKCPPDEFWAEAKGKKGKRFYEEWGKGKGKGKKAWYWTPG